MRPWRSVLCLLMVLVLCGAVTACPDEYTVPLTHGPIVGAVTPTSATVLLRTAAPFVGTVRLTSSSGAVIDTAFVTSSASDLTALVQVSGLLPATLYSVVALSSQDLGGGGQALQTSFTTFPPSTSTAPLTIVYLTDFQGPTGHPKEPTGVFAFAAAEAPTLVMLGGDFDHSNPGAIPKGTDPNIVIASYRAMWKGLYSPVAGVGLPSFASTIFAKFPVAHMLDDHDYGNNNENKDFKWRTQSVQVFKEYFPAYPIAAPAGSYGLWQRFSLAYADVFLADTRTQRTRGGAADNAQKSILDGNFLGSAGQLFWLTEGLRTSTAAWKIVMMPTPFNPTVIKKQQSLIWQQDSWTGYQTERNAFLATLAANGVKNVILLSGDLHAGGMDNGTNSGLIEMMTPSANFTSQSPERCLSADTIGTWSHGTYANTVPPRLCNGYGVVRLTPTAATLQVKDETGVVKLQLIVPVQ